MQDMELALSNDDLGHPIKVELRHGHDAMWTVQRCWAEPVLNLCFSQTAFHTCPRTRPCKIELYNPIHI